MRSIINELWHGNIIPQEDSRTNSKEMKELFGYMSQHHEDLEKTLSDEQKEIFEKFYDCRSEYMSFGEAAIFEYAFRLGAKFMHDVMYEEQFFDKIPEDKYKEIFFGENWFDLLIAYVAKTIPNQESIEKTRKFSRK